MPGESPGGSPVDGAADAAGDAVDGAKDIAADAVDGALNGLDVAARMAGDLVRGLVPPEALDALPFVLGWFL